MLQFKFDISLDGSLAPKIANKPDLFYRHGSFGWWPHKHWEIQIAQWSIETILSVDIDLRFRGSAHAGPKFCLEILGLMIDLHVYDSRHWDHENNCWEVYNNES